MFTNTLSGRFLVLTILFVMLAEVLVFVPSVIGLVLQEMWSQRGEGGGAKPQAA